MVVLERLAARRAVLAVILLIFIVCAIALSQVRLPHNDEGQFASCAWELVHKGRMAMPMLTEFLPSLDRYVYEAMPLYFLQLAAVSAFTGYEISTLRLDTVAWGVLLLLSCYLIVLRLTNDRLLAALTLLLVGINYDVLNITSGRYDPMCAALYLAGLACYLWLREKNLTRAVFLSHCLIMAACMTHPYGVFGLAGFGIMFAMLDLRRLTLRLVLIAIVPYAVALGAWGIYIAQDPKEFIIQWSTNAKGRLAPARYPISAIISEIRGRYIATFAGFRPGVPIYMRAKLLVLAAYMAGFAGCLLTPSIRKDRGRLILVLVALGFGVLLTFIEGQRLYIYFVHVLPFYSIVLAVWACYLLRRGGLIQKAALASIALFCIYSLVTVVYRVRLNDYHRLYVPTLEFLAANVHGSDLVMGPPEFGTRLGFRDHLLDDATLGFRNGLKPSYVVIDTDFEKREAALSQDNPAAFEHVQNVLARSDLLFHLEHGPNFYRVYRVR